MVTCHLVFLLFVLPNFSVFVPISYETEQKDADEAVQKFLSSQKSENEDAESQGSAVADLNGDGKSEIVLVWTTMGPTYWHNTLTVLTKTSRGYKPAASIPLIGEAKLSSTKGGIISVDQKVYAKKDPICCPSIKKQMKYRWQGKKISEVK
jgi:hypothetical protein